MVFLSMVSPFQNVPLLYTTRKGKQEKRSVQNQGLRGKTTIKHLGEFTALKQKNRHLRLF